MSFRRVLVFLFFVLLAALAVSLLPADLVAKPSWLNTRIIGATAAALGIYLVLSSIWRRMKENKQEAESHRHGRFLGV